MKDRILEIIEDIFYFIIVCLQCIGITVLIGLLGFISITIIVKIIDFIGGLL